MRAYLELLRLPNVFTAIADVLMGCWLAMACVPSYLAGPPPPLAVMLLLVTASGCLYLSGMVLNDYFDREQDAAERPERPIPSGRIAEASARLLGSTLMSLGIVSAGLASYRIGSARSALIAVALAAAILLYDAVLKRTPLGPLVMGCCRSLNVLLGMTVVSTAWQPAQFVAAGGIGLYIVGVTLFARTEAAVSRRGQLVGGMLLSLAGIGLLAYCSNVSPRPAMYIDQQLEIWYLFWGFLAAQIGWRLLQAIMYPQAANVQRAVKHCILSLIVFDATITFAVQGAAPSLIILSLLIPAILLGRWIYST